MSEQRFRRRVCCRPAIRDLPTQLSGPTCSNATRRFISRLQLLLPGLLLLTSGQFAIGEPRTHDETSSTAAVDVVEQLIRQLSDDDDAKVAAAIAEFRDNTDAAGTAPARLIELLAQTDRRITARRLLPHGSLSGLTTASLADHIQWLLEEQKRAAVPALVKGLKHDNPQVRGRCALALGSIKSEATIPFLLEALGDDNSFVSGAASSALKQIGKPAVPPLIAILIKGMELATKEKKDAPPSEAILKLQRERAAGALGEINDERSLKPLIQALEYNDRKLRSWTAHGLQKYALRLKNSHKTPPDLFSDEKIIRRLLRLLETDENAVSYAVRMMLSLVPKDSREPMVKALDSRDRRVRLALFGTWFSIFDNDLRVIPALLKRIPHVPNPDVALARRERSLGLRVLANHLDAVDKAEVLPVILERFLDPAEDVRYSAAYALQKAPKDWLRDPQIVPLLLTTLQVESDWQTRLGVIQVLGDCGDDRAVEPLIKLLNSEEMFTRHGKTPRKDMTDGTRSKDDEWIRTAICRAFVKIGDARAIPAMRQRLPLKEPFVLKALGELSDQKSVPALIAQLESDSVDLRIAAAQGLATTPSAEAQQPLIHALKKLQNAIITNRNASGYLELRAALAKALGAIGEPQGATELVRSLRVSLPTHGLFRGRATRTMPHDDPRARALRDMKEIAIPAIVSELADPASTLQSRRMCSWLAGEFGFSTELNKSTRKQLATAVLPVLSEKNIRNRMQAASALGRLKSADAVPEMYRQLQRASLQSRNSDEAEKTSAEDRQDLQLAILQGLSWSDFDAKSGHKLLAGHLTSSSERVRYAAVFAVVSAKHPGATNLLIPMLNDVATNVRWAAARQLGFVGDHAGVAPLIRLLEDEPSRPKSPPTKPRHDRQPYYSIHSSSEVMAMAIQSLGMIGATDSADDVYKTGASGDDDVKIKSAVALVQLDDQRGVELLRDLFSSEDERIRERTMSHAAHVSMYAEGGWGQSISLPDARSLLRDQAVNGSVRVRIYGPGALRGFSDEDTINTLVKICQEAEPHISSSALSELMKTGDSRRLKTLATFLTDKDSVCRSAAVHQYVQELTRPNPAFSPQEAVNMISRLLKDGDAGVRESALRSLTLIRDSHDIDLERVRPTLRTLSSSDATPIVRYLASTLLE